jgi:hypothetical protein
MVDAKEALIKMARFPFPYQRAQAFAAFPRSLQAEILKTEGLGRDFFMGLAMALRNIQPSELCLAASHPGCEPALLILLARESREIRACVAGNPSTPKPALMLLAGDPSPEIERALLDNPSSDAEVLAAVKSRLGFVEIEQGKRGLSEMTAAELRASGPIDGVRFLSSYRRPMRGACVYRIEQGGRLKLVESNYDSGD